MDDILARYILQRSAEWHEVTVEALVGRERGRLLSRARRHAVRWLQDVGYTQQQIGTLLGGRDASSVWWFLNTERRNP